MKNKLKLVIGLLTCSMVILLSGCGLGSSKVKIVNDTGTTFKKYVVKSGKKIIKQEKRTIKDEEVITVDIDSDYKDVDLTVEMEDAYGVKWSKKFNIEPEGDFTEVDIQDSDKGEESFKIKLKKAKDKIKNLF